jgi:hypothetical protein
VEMVVRFKVPGAVEILRKDVERPARNPTVRARELQGLRELGESLSSEQLKQITLNEIPFGKLFIIDWLNSSAGDLLVTTRMGGLFRESER